MAPNLNGPPKIILKWAPNKNIDPGGSGLFNLIFVNQLYGSPAIISKWAPINNVDPGGPVPLNLIFANQFKWAPYNNI